MQSPKDLLSELSLRTLGNKALVPVHEVESIERIAASKKGRGSSQNSALALLVA